MSGKRKASDTDKGKNITCVKKDARCKKENVNIINPWIFVSYYVKYICLCTTGLYMIWNISNSHENMFGLWKNLCKEKMREKLCTYTELSDSPRYNESYSHQRGIYIQWLCAIQWDRSHHNLWAKLPFLLQNQYCMREINHLQRCIDSPR